MGHPMFHLTPPLHLEECLIWMQLQRVQVLEYDLISWPCVTYDFCWQEKPQEILKEQVPQLSSC